MLYQRGKHINRQGGQLGPTARFFIPCGLRFSWSGPGPHFSFFLFLVPARRLNSRDKSERTVYIRKTLKLTERCIWGTFARLKAKTSGWCHGCCLHVPQQCVQGLCSFHKILSDVVASHPSFISSRFQSNVAYNLEKKGNTPPCSPSPLLSVTVESQV